MSDVCAQAGPVHLVRRLPRHPRERDFYRMFGTQILRRDLCRSPRAGEICL